MEKKEELTEWDIEQLNRLCEGNKRVGYIVTTKNGIRGRTFHHEGQINGKQVVHTEKGKLLCDPESLILNGFID